MIHTRSKRSPGFIVDHAPALTEACKKNHLLCADLYRNLIYNPDFGPYNALFDGIQGPITEMAPNKPEHRYVLDPRGKQVKEIIPYSK